MPSRSPSIARPAAAGLGQGALRDLAPRSHQAAERAAHASPRAHARARRSQHYFIGQDEVTKLLERGEGWLPVHPQRDLIVGRYLGRRRALINAALARLIEADGSDPEPVLDPPAAAMAKPRSRSRCRLARAPARSSVRDHRRRRRQARAGPRLWQRQAARRLLRQRGIDEIVGVEVSSFELARATKYFAPAARGRQATPEALAGLAQLPRHAAGAGSMRRRWSKSSSIWSRIAWCSWSAPCSAMPGRAIVVTTPNRDCNVLFPSSEPSPPAPPGPSVRVIAAGVSSWADAVAARNGYAGAVRGVGEEHRARRTYQLAVFTR